PRCVAEGVPDRRSPSVLVGSALDLVRRGGRTPAEAGREGEPEWLGGRFLERAVGAGRCRRGASREARKRGGDGEGGGAAKQATAAQGSLRQGLLRDGPLRHGRPRRRH